MHMAFLSREFKNLQWYGMTYRADVTDFSYIHFFPKCIDKGIVCEYAIMI